MATVLKNLTRKSSVMRQLFVFLWQNKMWWMIPILLVMILLSAMIWLTQTAAIPYIYTLF